MVFSSLPIYLDPPDWQQNDQQGTVSESNPQLVTPPPSHGGGPIRTGSTADRARLAKITQPEATVKCPRCESTNTKFCYYNNYSLTQPRHFCKTCRRYWTNGGNLRNVPVGGSCRRSKKNKKSSTSTDQKQVSVTQPVQITAHLPHQLASLQNFSQYGLNFGGIHHGGGAEMGFQQQLSFFEQNNGNLYPFQNEGIIDSSSSSRVSHQLAPLMKTENDQRLNLSRSQLGSAENQYWGANSWTDLSGLSSSTTNHLL